MVDSQSDRGTLRGNMKTAIVGGGLSGLTIGYLLNKQGLNLGFRARIKLWWAMKDLNEKGFTFDLGGSHIIFSKNESVLKFMLELLKGNKVKNKRNTKVLYKGCYVKYPFENGLSDLPLEENFECLNSFIHGLLSRAKERDCKAVNLEEWFYRTFGDGITEKYLMPYNEKIWKFSVKEMGLDWVERIPDPSVEDIIRLWEFQLKDILIK